MATSGDIVLASSRDLLITEAMEYMGVLGEGGTPTANQLTSMTRTLEYFIKHVQVVHGGHIFATERWYVFLKKGQNKFTLKTSATDLFCRQSAFTNTFVKTAGVATDTSIVVDSITGVSENDKIGIETTSNVVEWFDVAAGSAGNTINIDGGSGSGLAAAAAVDNQVYTYTPVTTTAAREMPLLIEGIWRQDAFVATSGDAGQNIPLSEMARNDFMDLSNKTTDGVPNQWYYDRQRMHGDLYVWPETTDETQFLSMWVQRPLEDLNADSAAEEPDYPQEWFLTLAYNLAKYSLTKYGCDESRTQLIFALSDSLLKDALASDAAKFALIAPDERWD